MRRLVIVPVLLLSAATGCGVLDQFVLRPSGNIRMTPKDFGYDFDKLSLPMGDLDQISIWHVKTTVAKKGILVIIPGNDANKGRYTVALPIFADDGWDVILMDYAGYGESTGEATFSGLIESTRTVLDYAFAQSDTVVALGASMGSPVLARVAADYDFTACIFESTMNLWKEGAAFLDRHNLGSPFNLVTDTFTALTTPQDYDTRYWIQQVAEPKLFLHSPDDNFTPYAEAWEIYKLAPQPKHLIATQGEHALQMFIDPVLYRSMVNGYLNGVLNQDPIINQRFQELLDGEIRAALEEVGITPASAARKK